MNLDFPVTTATGMGPLPQLLEQMEGEKAVRSVFARVELPLMLIEEPNHLIPMESMVRLFSEAAHQAGDRAFGLRVGMNMTAASYGLWTQYSTQADTFGGAIRRLASTLRLHQTFGDMRLVAGQKWASWTYISPKTRANDLRAHADHALPTMIKIARSYLGENWMPQSVGMPYKNDGAETALSDVLPVRWRFESSGVRLDFPVSCLSQRRSISRILGQAPVTTRLDVVAESRLKDAHNAMDGFESLVLLRLLEGYTDVEGAARMVHMGVRKLQRELDRGGEGYRSILSRVRHQRALALLADTDLPVTEIAIMLGYSDPANFTRAFRKIAGGSPQPVRALLRRQAMGKAH